MSRQPLDYSLPYHELNLRKRRDLYRIGRGEQGVLLVEPYKSEILPHWRFKTVKEARKSAASIYRQFANYLRADDFPGADMARKFLQMGWTRARRYANHPDGKKYDGETGMTLPRGNDREKAAAAEVFYNMYVKAREDLAYKRLKQQHILKFETE